MTARRTDRVLAVFAVAAFTLVGCADETVREDHETRSLERDIKALSSRDIAIRLKGAIGVSQVCCSFDADAWRPVRAHVRLRACDVLEKTLMVERDPEVLDALLTSDPQGCAVTVSPELLLDLAARTYPPGLQLDATQWLQVVEPSRSLAVLLFDQLRKGHPNTPRSLRAILATFGESDLASVVDATADSDARVRELAVRVLDDALSEGALDAPEALRAFDRLAKDSDEELAFAAQRAAAKYRAYRGPPDAVVERYIADDLSFQEIRMLGVRRYLCSSQVAQAVLERAGRGEDVQPARAIAAKRALAFRSRRCQSTVQGAP